MLARIDLTPSVATLGAQLGVLAGHCAHVDVAGAGSSIQLAARDGLVLRDAFEGSLHRLHLVVVRIVVSLGVRPLLVRRGATLAHRGGQLPRVLRRRVVEASRRGTADPCSIPLSGLALARRSVQLRGRGSPRLAT